MMTDIEFTEDGMFKWMEDEIAFANSRADGVKLNPDVLQALINEVRKLRTEVAIFRAGTPDNPDWMPSDWLMGDETGSVHRWMEIEMERMRNTALSQPAPAPQAEWTPRIDDTVFYRDGVYRIVEIRNGRVCLGEAVQPELYPDQLWVDDINELTPTWDDNAAD